MCAAKRSLTVGGRVPRRGGGVATVLEEAVVGRAEAGERRVWRAVAAEVRHRGGRRGRGRARRPAAAHAHADSAATAATAAERRRSAEC